MIYSEPEVSPDKIPDSVQVTAYIQEAPFMKMPSQKYRLTAFWDAD